MAEKLGEALLDLDTNDKPFNQGVDRAEKRAAGLGRVLDDTARRAAQLGKTLAVAVVVGGLGAMAAGIVGAVKRLEEMRKMSGQVDRALANSGNTARTSAKEIEAWADALENRTGRAVEEVMEISANLASYGFGREEFYRAIELADDMAAAWGGDLRQNLEGLGRALDDPINGMAMLSKRGIKLTEEQKALAASLIASGEKAKAQGVVFDALEGQVKGVAEAGFGGLTRALAEAQKVWETAFEDLVTGKGNTEDLRQSLIDLAGVLSSPQFVEAATGFGTVLVNMTKQVADGFVNAANNARMLMDFIANGRGDLAGMSSDGLSGKLREIGLQKLALDNQIVGQQSRLDRGDTGLFGMNTGALQGGVQSAKDQIAALVEQERQILAILDQRKTPPAASKPVATGFGSVTPFSVTEIEQQTEALGGLNAVTEEHTAQLERMEGVYDLLGDAGVVAIQGIVGAMEDGKIEGQELLSILGNVLSMAGQFFLNEAFSGMKGGGGVGAMLGDVFAGLFANGGLIPNGSFGIVGEEGPELAFGGPGGTQVFSNSDSREMLGGGGGGGMVNHITINGSGLSEVELRRAIGDALDRFNRFTLPARVGEINRDPFAVG